MNESNTLGPAVSQNRFSKIGALVIFGLVFLLPIFFVPSQTISLHASKIVLLTVGLAVLLVMFLSSVLSNGLVSIPKAKFLFGIVGLALAALASSLLSGYINDSLTGSVFEIYTSGVILLLTALLFLVMVNVGNQESLIRKTIYLFLVSSGLVSVFLIVRALFLTNLPANFFLKIPNFLPGTAVDSAVLLGAALIAALATLNMVEMSKRNKYALIALAVFSTLFIGVVNFRPVIITVGLLALVYFVYILSWSVSKDVSIVTPQRKVSLLSLFVIVASLIFLISGPTVNVYLARTFKINIIEIRPNFEATMNLASKVLSEKPVLGVGPNRFSQFWSLNKPLEVNLSQFWNVDFNSGFGLIPTMAINVGILGLIAIFAFLYFMISSGVKAIFSAGDDNSRYAVTTTFLTSLYFWIMFFVYSPSITNLGLAFIMTGLFAVALVGRGTVNVTKINIFSNPKTNFVTILGIVVFLLASISGGYFVVEKIVANSLYNKSIVSLQNGDLAQAKAKMVQAINIAPTSLYWRGLSEISINEINTTITSETKNGRLSEAGAATVQGLIADTIESGRQAVQNDDGDYQNWFALGRIYEILASNGIDGALENARANYAEAEKRAPTNPAIALVFARVNAMSGDLKAARENIKRSLDLKRNYTDAYFTLAQIEASANNITEAIQSVEAAAFLDPQNAGLYFQLGLLKYNNGDYRGASSAFERAVTLVSDYANARYFLGLSYERLGKRADAIAQFEIIQKTNSDNAEIALILKNLQAGKSPFRDAKPPVDDKPEKRSEPPLEE